MSIQKKDIAPVTQDVWNELEETARSLLSATLTARMVVDVSGPHGWQFSGVSEGRVQQPSGQESTQAEFGVRVVRPLVEARFPFSLDLSELEAAGRGAPDADFSTLEQAASDAARFEDRAVFSGLSLGGIDGLADVGAHSIKKGNDSYLSVSVKGADLLRKAGIAGPYALVVSTATREDLANEPGGYPTEKRITETIDGQILHCPNIDDTYLVSLRGGDLTLTIGQDLTLRYRSRTEDAVNMDIVETFTFAVHEPRAYVKILS